MSTRDDHSLADVDRARAQVHETCLWLVAQGLVVGSAGYVIVRVGPHHAVVSAGGVLYELLTADDHPLVDLRDGAWTGPRAPTSELHLHRDVLLAMPEVAAIVHTHSRAAAAFAVAGRDLPFVCNENMGPAAERVLVTDYALPSSDDLGRHALATLRRQPGSRACLLANHGVVAVGAGAVEARVIAAQVEWIADIVWRAEGLGGARILPRATAAAVCAAYRVPFAVEAHPTGADGLPMPAGAAELIERLGLHALPIEGGWYRQTWRSDTVDADGTPAGTAIVAVFVAGRLDGSSTFHRLTRDEVWTAMGGDPFRLVLLHPDGAATEHLVGLGHTPQVTVPAGAWMGGHPVDGGPAGYSVVGCTMAPGFTPGCFLGARRSVLLADWPGRADDIIRLTHPDSDDPHHGLLDHDPDA